MSIGRINPIKRHPPLPASPPIGGEEHDVFGTFHGTKVSAYERGSPEPLLLGLPYPMSGSGEPRSRQGYRYFAGRIIARHMCATGLLS